MKCKQNRNLVNIYGVLVLTLGFQMATPGALYAGNTWTGGGSSPFNWSDSANWSGSAPAFGSITFSGTAGTINTLNGNFTSGGTANMNDVFWNNATGWTMNNANSTTLSLYDNSGNQSKLENDGAGLVAINAPITFAATAGPVWGEINAVSGGMTFGSGYTLTVNGSQLSYIKMFGSGQTLTFNNTVSASGKAFYYTGASGNILNIGGAFTSGDFFVMNGSALNLNSGGSLTTTELRLGGDYGTTLTQNQTLGGTFNLAAASGGQIFSSGINSVSGNTSGALVVNSQNTSGANTLSGAIALDSTLKFTQSGGGTLNLSSGSVDVKAQQIIFTPAASGTINVVEALTSSLGAGGTLLMNGAGTLTLQNTGNNYTGTSTSSLNASGTQITGGGILGIYGDACLGLVPNTAYNNIQFTGSGTLQDSFGNISLSANRNILVGASQTATFDTLANTFTIPGIISGSAVAKAGSGTLVLSGANTFTGGLTVNNGTVSFASDGTSGGQKLGGYPGSVSAANVTVNGGTLLASGSTTIAVNRGITLGASGGTIDATSGNTLTVNSVITGGALTKANVNSTLNLGTANTYTGATIVNGGTLLLGNSGSLAAGSAVTLNGGATLGGSGTINGTVTVNANGFLLPGGGNTVGTLTLANAGASALTMNGGTMIMDLPSSGSTCDKIAVTGNLVLNGNVSVYLTFPSGTATSGTTFTLMTYAAKSGSGTITLAGSYNGTPTLTVGATSVTVSFSGTASAGPDVWKGTTSGTWDTTTTANWTKSGVSSAYTSGDNVLFDDSASGNFTISIPNTSASTITPGNINLDNSANAYVINAPMGGSGSLTKNGSAYLTLGPSLTKAATTTSGNTTVTMTDTTGVQAGMAISGLGCPSGAYITTVNAGASVVVSSAPTGASVGSGNVTVSGNVYSGGTTINSGTLKIGSAGAAASSTVKSGATGTGNVTLGAGATIDNSASGNNWYTPQLTLNGDITLAGGNRLTTSFGTLDLGGGAPRKIYVNSKSTAINTIGGIISTNGNGLGGPENTGNGSWDVNNTMGSSMTIQNGSLDLETTAFFGSTYGSLLFNNSTWLNFSGNAAFTIGPNVYVYNNGSFNTTTGSPKLTVSSGGYMSMLDAALTVYSLAGGGTVTLGMDLQKQTAQTLTIGVSGGTGSTTFSGVLQDGAGLTGGEKLSVTKAGSGSTQTLSGNNTFSGSVSVTAGSLQLGSANALGWGVTANASTVAGTTVSGSATLDLNGMTGVNEPITLNASSTFQNSASGTPAAIGSGLAGIAITTPGTGYGSAPSVVVSGGGGSGAAATASLGLTSSTLQQALGGSGWALNDTFTTTGGSGYGALMKVLTVSSGAIQTWSLVAPGFGYTDASQPTGITKCTSSSGSGAGVTLGYSNNKLQISMVILTSAGSGYSSVPTVTLNGSDTTSLTAVLPTVTLAGSATIDTLGNLTIPGAIVDNGGGYGFTKTSSGTLTLSGTNVYGGATIISVGTLKLTGGALSNTAVNVSSGTTFAVQPGSSTAISVGSAAVAAAGATLNLGGTFDMTDGAISTNYFVQGGSVTTGMNLTNGATLKFDLGGNTTAADQLAVSKAAAVSGTINVTVNPIGSTALASGTSYPLVTAASGLTGGTWQFTGGGTKQTVTFGGTRSSLRLSAAAGAVSLGVTNAYTLTYDPNTATSGTAPTDANSPYDSGGTVTVLGNTGSLIKTGYAFNGWNTAANGSGTAYAANATFAIAADTTLYAQWQLASATINTSGSLSAFSTTYGTASASQTFTVSGAGIIGGILVTAPTGFEVSQSSGSGYGATTTVSGTGSIAATTIYVRLAATTGYGTYSGNMACSSSGATTVTVAVPSSTVSTLGETILGAVAVSKMYDGTTNAVITGTLSPGAVNGDVITLTTNGGFTAGGGPTSAVGGPYTVAANFSLSGAAAANYSLTQPSGLTASIYGTAIWTNAANNQPWSAALNWSNNVVATNVGNTADFSQVSISSDTTVNLDAPYTIGNLIFGNGAGSPNANWILANNSIPANILTLAGTTPTVTVNSLGTGKSASINAVLVGTSGLTKAGGGTLALSAANTYTGTTVIGAGIVQANATETAGASGPLGKSATANAGSISFGGGTLQYGSANQNDYSGRFSTASSQAIKVDLNSQAVTYATALTSSGGSLSVGDSGTGGKLTLSAANTFSGGVTLNSGTLNLNNAGSGGTSSAIGTGTFTINGGTIDTTTSGTIALSTANPMNWNGDFTFTGTKSLTFGSGAVTLGGNRLVTANASTLTFGGTVGDGGHAYTLTKSGGGTLRFNNNATYTGLTTLNAGSIVLDASLSGAVSVTSGNFQLGSGSDTAGSIGGNVSVSGGAIQFSRTDTNAPIAGTITATGGALTIYQTNAVFVLNSANFPANSSNYWANLSGGGSGYAGTIQFNGDPASTNVINTAPGDANQILEVKNGTVILNGGRHIKNNVLVDGGILTLGSGADRLGFDQGGSQTLNITGGILTVPSTAAYGARLGCDSGPSTGASVSFAGIQSGGVFNVNKGGPASTSFQLGGLTGANTDTYVLSGGTLDIIGAGTDGYLQLGADTGGASTASFTLSGTGKLIVSSTIQGTQGSGAVQNFVFNGGTLVANFIDMTKLTTAGATTGSASTLNNNGGTLAPGDLGLPGKTSITGNYTVTSGTLAVDIGGASAASIFQDGTSNSYDNLSITGAATMGGNLTVNVLNNFDPSGKSFTIVNATGGASGSFANVSSGRVSVANRTGASFRVTVSGNTVVLDQYSSLLWNGNNGNDWSTAGNWKDSATGSAASYSDSETVTFDDTAVSANVSLNQTVTPSLVTFSNATANYTVSGSGKISGGAIVDKLGAGTASLLTANDYTSQTTVSGGALNIQNANALGSVSAGTVVNNGAELQVQGGITTLAEPLTLSGNGTNSTGALRNISGNNIYAGAITLGAAARIGSDSGTLTLSSATAITSAYGLTFGGSGDVVVNTPIQTGNNSVTEIGSGTLTLAGVNTYAGNTTVSGGTLTLSGSGTLGNSSALILNGGTLDLGTLSSSVAGMSITAAPTTGNAIQNGSLTATSYAASLTSGNAIVTANLLANGSAGLTKSGAGILTLSGANTFTGNTTISAGKLVGTTLGSCGASAITVSVGATNGVQLATAGGEWTCNGLTYNSGTTYMDFDFNSFAPSTTTAPLSVGTLSANGTVNVILRNVTIPATVGNYPLVNYTGTDPSVSSFNLNSVLPLVTNAVGGLVVDTVNKNLAIGVHLVVPNLAYTNTWLSRQIALADILAAGLASSQGSPIYSITLPSLTSAQGGSVITNSGGNIILYRPPTGTPANDSFSYTVADGVNSATATVTITFASATGPQLTPTLNGSNNPIVSFHGIPGYSYHIQRATTLSPSDWTPVQAVSLPSNGDGSYSWTDTGVTVPPATVYYRLSYP